MIHVVGLGGVGFWLTTALVRSVSSRDVCCWDSDNLEGGFGHRRLPIASPQTRKTDLLRGYLLVTMGDMLPTFYSRLFTGNITSPGDIVIDCTDMPLARRRVMWHRVQNRGGKLIRVSYDGRSSVVVVSNGLPFVGKVGGGYAEIPTLALSLVAGGLGAEVVRLWLGNTEKFVDCQLSIKEFACSS